LLRDRLGVLDKSKSRARLVASGNRQLGDFIDVISTVTETSRRAPDQRAIIATSVSGIRATRRSMGSR